MELPDGAQLAAGEAEKIDAAVQALVNDVHAPRDLSVKVVLQVHREFPKAIVVGKDKEGAPIQKIANSAAEEAALIGGLEVKEEKQPEPIVDQLSEGVVQKGVA